MTRILFSLLAIIYLTACGCGNALGDTIHLRNGKTLEGRIESERGDKVIIEMSFGKIECRKDQILKVVPSPAYNDQIADAVARRFERPGPQQVNVIVSKDSKSICVDAILNKHVKARLIVDTGASIIVLSKKIGTALGLKTQSGGSNTTQLQLTGGKKVDAKVFILDNIKIGYVEAKDVMAAVLLEDAPGEQLEDGLLGMSFLKRYDVKFDLKANKMFLQKQD